MGWVTAVVNAVESRSSGTERCCWRMLTLHSMVEFQSCGHMWTHATRLWASRLVGWARIRHAWYKNLFTMIRAWVKSLNFVFNTNFSLGIVTQYPIFKIFSLPTLWEKLRNGRVGKHGSSGRSYHHTYTLYFKNQCPSPESSVDLNFCHKLSGLYSES